MAAKLIQLAFTVSPDGKTVSVVGADGKDASKVEVTHGDYVQWCFVPGQVFRAASVSLKCASPFEGSVMSVQIINTDAPYLPAHPFSVACGAQTAANKEFTYKYCVTVEKGGVLLSPCNEGVLKIAATP